MPIQVGGTDVIDDNLNVILGSLAAAPESPSVGTIFFNSDTGTVYGWNGVEWIELTGDPFLKVAYSWGRNLTSRLGHSQFLVSSPYSVLGGYTDWSHISAGHSHSLGTRSGIAMAWGRNSAGELGTGGTDNKSIPTLVAGGFTDWVAVYAAFESYMSIGRRSNGTLWTWGSQGYSGALGDGTITNRSSPVSVIGGFTDWAQCSAGFRFAAAVRSNGTLWSWGRNDFGKLGDNTETNRSSPVSVVGGFTDWAQVSCGRDHTIAIKTTGHVWGWGKNNRAQLDSTTASRSSPIQIGGGATNWAQVSCGFDFTLAIKTTGALYGWGWYSNSGNLGNGVTGFFSSTGNPVRESGNFTDWTEIHAGKYHSIGTRSNGSAWSWGANTYGTLGDGTTTNRSSPVSVIGGLNWTKVSASRGDFNHTLGIAK